jgi:hypothetical protein
MQISGGPCREGAAATTTTSKMVIAACARASGRKDTGMRATTLRAENTIP